jgi:hypothetical protein
MGSMSNFQLSLDRVDCVYAVVASGTLSWISVVVWRHQLQIVFKIPRFAGGEICFHHLRVSRSLAIVG